MREMRMVRFLPILWAIIPEGMANTAYATATLP